MNNLGARWNRMLLGSGIFLMMLGAFHIAIQLFVPRPWESNVGWRKPILFGLSTGITLISLSWVVSVVEKRGGWIPAGIISVLGVTEVSIITIQTWRGVPAHFNNGSLVDQILANSIDAMLIFITLAIFYLTWRSFKKLDVESDWLLSLQVGMIYLSVACLLGFGVAIYGNFMLGVGGDPTLVNPNGVPKFVHGMPLHALQILPGVVFILRLFNSNINNRRQAVWFVSYAIALTTLYAFWQTVNGMGRFEPNLVGILLICATGVCSLIAAIFAFSYQNKTRAFSG